jgi:hypothetical protein
MAFVGTADDHGRARCARALPHHRPRRSRSSPRAQVFVSDSVLLASASEGRTVVAEKGPHGMGVREMVDHHLAVTNHFLSSAWLAGPCQCRTHRPRHHRPSAGRAPSSCCWPPRCTTPPASSALLRDRRGRGGRRRSRLRQPQHHQCLDRRPPGGLRCHRQAALGVRALRMASAGRWPSAWMARSAGASLPESEDLALYLAHGDEYATPSRTRSPPCCMPGRRSRGRGAGAVRLLDPQPAQFLHRQCPRRPGERRSGLSAASCCCGRATSSRPMPPMPKRITELLGSP